MAPIDLWGPHVCPECGAPPFEYCQSKTGRRAANIHRVRFPEDVRPEPKVYGQRKRERAERRAQVAEKVAEETRRGLPLDVALRSIEEARMAAFRVRSAT